jgi:hypothetical protein
MAGPAEPSHDPVRPPRKRRNRPPRKRTEPATIDDSTLLDRLKQHALGEVDMTSTQVRAAELALKKAEVALKKAEAADEPASRAVRAIISAEPLSDDEWERQYALPSSGGVAA